ncbi:AimR family lysis-lysogeny pheromone receptor [Bacillus atrophaeus]|uniref:AimR family lysis-lysogeny pheromone receptor n=1 Tax=Bacillus atrophaeus TaxID=1452 RepID=UPI002E1D836E|nr:AimR family lysis-lysogeny pheromone receptor [Bacillus atrophaeus]
MEAIRRELCDFIEDHDIKYTQVARALRVDKSSMAKFKKEGTIGFRSLVIMAHLLFPEKADKKISKWCIQLDDSSKEMVKQAFEYAAITRNTDLLNYLINEHQNKSHLKSYVSLYKIIYDYMLVKLSIKDMIKEMSEFKASKDKELRILAGIYKCYGYYSLGDYFRVVSDAMDIGKNINRMSDKRELFIKECYIHRFAEMLAPTYLKLNNLKGAEHYANIMLKANISAKLKADATYILGMTKLIQDSEASLRFFRESHSLMLETGVDYLINDAYNNLTMAMAYVNRENKDELKRYLGNLKEVVYLEEGDSFYECLKIYEKGGIENLLEGHRNFLYKSNFFISALIASDLLSTGIHPYLLETLSSYTHNKKEMFYFEEDFIECFSDRSDFFSNRTA